MSLNVARLIRVFAAAALPVPLFVVGFCFSFLYLEYQGYSFENGTYFTSAMSFANSRHRAWETLWILLVMGYVLMCVPSFLYSFSLEFYRGKPSARYAGYVALGGALGGLASIFFIWLNPGCLVVGYWDIVTAYLLSVSIGAGIAALLSRIGPPKLKTGADSLRGEPVA